MTPPRLAFPPDVWRTLLRYLENYELMALWMTGSRSIRSNTGLGGGWDYFLVDENLPLRKWPRQTLPHLLGLSHLDIYPRGFEVFASGLHPSISDLDQLPKTLMKLEIGLLDPLTDGHLPHLPRGLLHLHLPLDNCISPSGLASLPPELETLDLRSNQLICDPSLLPRTLRSFIGNCHTMKPCDMTFEGWPQDLDYLKLHSKEENSSWTLRDLDRFHTLEHLTTLAVYAVSQSNMAVTDVVRFPPELLKLTIVGDARFSESLVKSLPRNLVTLKLLSHRLVEDHWQDQWISFLPRSLTDLRLVPYRDGPLRYRPVAPPLTIRCLGHLPPRLKTLRLHTLTPVASADLISQLPAPGVAEIVWGEFGGYIPSSVTDLQVRMITPSGSYSLPLKALSDGIRDVRSFGLIMTSEFDVNVASGATAVDCDLINQKLGRLSTVHIGTSVVRYHPGCEHLAVLSDNKGDADDELAKKAAEYVLSKLKTTFPACRSLSVTNMELDFWPQLRSMKLTTLTMRLRRNAPALQDKDILLLPDTLTSLSLDGPALSDECIPALPHGLTHLELVPSYNIQGDIFPWPPQLTSLTLNNMSSDYGEYATSDLYTLQLYIPYLIQRLRLRSGTISNESFMRPRPSSIAPSSDKLASSSNSEGSGEWFPGIKNWYRRIAALAQPRRVSFPFLTYLSLPDSKAVTSAIFEFLPTTVTHIIIPYLTLEEKDIKRLPRNLRHFDAYRGNTCVSDSSVLDWPTRLQLLRLESALLTNEGIAQLPKSLTILHIDMCALVDHDTLGNYLTPNIRGARIHGWGFGEVNMED